MRMCREIDWSDWADRNIDSAERIEDSNCRIFLSVVKIEQSAIKNVLKQFKCEIKWDFT